MPDTSEATLPLLNDADVSRVLCVVAHPDDMEYGTSAAVAAWAARGVHVAYLLLTSGEAGMQIPPAEAGPLRAAEQQRACETVGVNDLTILNHPDGMLMYGLDLRRDIARAIRQTRPDLVITTNFDVEAYGGLNQADHRAAGLSVMDACRDADNTWVFPELAEAGLSKHLAQFLLVAGHPQPTHAVPVDRKAVDAAIASLRCHVAYLDALPGHPDPGDLIPSALAAGGAAAGREFAVPFKVYALGGVAA